MNTKTIRVWSFIDKRSFFSYFRVSTNGTLLASVGERVQRAFDDVVSFRPESVFVGTWDRVGSYDRGTDKVYYIPLFNAGSIGCLDVV